MIFDIANPQNTAISLKHIHFIDKIKLILYPSPEFFTTSSRRGETLYVYFCLCYKRKKGDLVDVRWLGGSNP